MYSVQLQDCACRLCHPSSEKAVSSKVQADLVHNPGSSGMLECVQWRVQASSAFDAQRVANKSGITFGMLRGKAISSKLSTEHRPSKEVDRCNSLPNTIK